MAEFQTSFATVSLNNQPAGSSQLSLDDKLGAISAAGFEHIELGFPDVVAFASQHHGRQIQADDYDALVAACTEIKALVVRHTLKILMLQPFANFEGWPVNSPERQAAFARAEGWIRVMQAVGTDMLQVGSTDTPSPPLSDDPNDLSRDLAELADLLAPHGFRLCYENWCWATHGQTWKQVWQIAQRADRLNIGLCLDTFQEAGAQWADPTKSSGRIQHDDLSAKQLHEQYLASLRELATTIPAEKIYVLQISDGYRPTPPLSDKPDQTGLRPRGQWSMGHRPMPYDGGYLPITEMTRAVMDTGFKGVYSMEVFDGGPKGNGKAKDPRDYTVKAKSNLKRLIQDARQLQL
ncbi:MAG: hypothetical protein Q9162_002062 [Coniocarpon cinnabarinum]